MGLKERETHEYAVFHFFSYYMIIWAVKACEYRIVKYFLMKFVLKEKAAFQRNDLFHEIIIQTNSNIEKF